VHQDDVGVDRKRALFERAEVHFNVGEFQKALDLYSKAFKTKQLPAFLFNIAQCHRYLKEYVCVSDGEKAVCGGLLYVVESGETELGRLFLTHGHQGTLLSDRMGELGKFLVRNLWRPIQRLTNIRSATPAKDFALKEGHAKAMYRWVSNRKGLVLIAGHTHHPVFEARTHEEVLKADIAAAKEELARAHDDKSRQAAREKIYAASAHLEWVRAETGGEIRLEAKTPCYFNTGCGSFSDGTVTGIEVADGQIQLVRWPNDDGKPERKVCADADLRRVLQDCNGTVTNP